MPLLNYTTEVKVDKTITELQQLLIKAKAIAVLCDYDGATNVTAISFKVNTQFGIMSFRLPADPSPVAQLLKSQAVAGKIPRRYINDMDQARRVCWRIIKQWVESQTALIEIGMVTVEQVFLPYAQNDRGQTVYESLVATKFESLALPAHREE